MTDPTDLIQRLRKPPMTTTVSGLYALCHEAATALEARATTAPASLLPVSEREKFERHYERALDFQLQKDAWGRDQYRHSHIQSLWEGWQARAALATTAQPAVESIQAGREG